MKNILKKILNNKKTKTKISKKTKPVKKEIKPKKVSKLAKVNGMTINPDKFPRFNPEQSKSFVALKCLELLVSRY